jgi:AraC-like DNA-binding protein
MNSPVVYITITGMLLSALLFFYNEGYNKANRYLAGFLFLSSLFYLIQYVFIFSHSLKAITWFAAGLPATVYLIGPFAFLYIRSILRDNTRLSKKDYLHFLIFIVVLIGTIPYIISSLEYKMNIARCIESNDWGTLKYKPNVIVPPIINRIMRPLHPLIYAIATWCLIFNYKDKIFKNKNHSYDFIVIKKWILIFSGFVLMATLLHQVLFINSLLVVGKSAFINQSYPLMLLFSVLYLLLMVSLLFFPHILYGMPVKKSESTLIPIEVSNFNEAVIHTEKKTKEISKDEINTEDGEENENDEKYVQLFSTEYLTEIQKKVDSWISDELYLEVDCSFLNLAMYLEIPKHHLNYFFNTILDKKFIDWRNNLRIEYSRLLIEKDILKEITIEALALKSGFSSQSTFNRAFKIYLGVTPSQYIRLKT